MSTTEAASHFDIVVVGGGMTGTAAAINIAARQACAGLKVAVVEAGQAPQRFQGEQFDPRVVALSQRSEQQLASLGVWRDITTRRACPYVSMDIWDAEGTGSIQFHSSDLHLPALGHIVENSVVVKSLEDRLCQLPVTQLLGYRVVDYRRDSDSTVSLLTLDNGDSRATISATLTVAADGAGSQLRQLAEVPTREWDYGHTAIVTTVRSEQPHRHCCWQRFTSDGPIAFLPLQPGTGSDDQSFCSLVWSARTELADELMLLDDEAFCERLGRAFEYRLGNVSASAPRHAIPLRQRHARHYVKPGLALVGDAAHTIHPLAGQGVNLGFYDVEALAAEIERACRRQVPLADGSLLRRYQRQRQSHNLATMAAMEGFKRLFGADDPAVRWLRNTGMTFVNNQLFLKKQLARVASGQL